MEYEDLPQPDFEGTVDPNALQTDGDNPNQMTEEQFTLLCERMQDNGWLSGPILTDTDGLIVDGEHRWLAAQEIGLESVPVRQYNIPDGKRRMWRQELNKIAGEHDRDQDALEYDKLLSEGYVNPVEDLVATTDEDLEDLLNDVTDPSDTQEAIEEAAETPTATDDITPTQPDDPNEPPEVKKTDAEADPRQEWDESGSADFENEQKLPRYTEVKVKFQDQEAVEEFAELVNQTVTKKTNVIHYPPSEEWSYNKHRASKEGLETHE